MIVDVRDIVNLKNVKFDENGHVVTQFGNINQQRTNLRPMTKNLVPKVYEEEFNGKHLFHNYGHCGHGWSTLFGTVDKSIHQFEKHKVKLDEKIVVIGIGIIGLYTAFSLSNLGFNNIEVIAEEKAHTTSEAAGAMINIIKSSNNYTDDDRVVLNQYFLTTYMKYKYIHENRDKLSSEFAKLIHPILHISKITNNDLGLIDLVKKNYIKKVEDVTLIYGSKDEPKYIKDDLCGLNTYVVDNIKWMEKMTELIFKNGVKISLQKINNFKEISYSNYIFNCSGLGSIELVGDKELYPSCGHVVNLRNQKFDIGQKIDIGLSLPSIPNLPTNISNGNIYLYFKENNTLLGGTYIPNYYGDDSLRNKEEITNIVHRARYFFNGIIPNKQTLTPKF